MSGFQEKMTRSDKSQESQSEETEQQNWIYIWQRFWNYHNRELKQKINMLMDLMENDGNMQEQMGDINEETETVRAKK